MSLACLNGWQEKEGLWNRFVCACKNLQGWDRKVKCRFEDW